MNNKKENIKFIGIIIYCPNLKKEITLKQEDFYISSNSSPCETCGDHGEISLGINKCECEKYHSDIRLKEW